MKKRSKLVVTALIMFCVVFGFNTPAFAKGKIQAPKTVKAKQGTYGAYVRKHYQELMKKGIQVGDGNSIEVSWSKVPKASGYEVKVTWREMELGTLSKTKVNVKKSGGKYIFTTKSNPIAKSTKAQIYKGGTSLRFTGKKLAFFQSACGSCVEAKKVQVRSYRIVKGKKIYSPYKTKKIK